MHLRLRHQQTKRKILSSVGFFGQFLGSQVWKQVMTSAADEKVQVFVFRRRPLAARVGTRRPGAPPGSSLGYTLSPTGEAVQLRVVTVFVIV